LSAIQRVWARLIATLLDPDVGIRVDASAAGGGSSDLLLCNTQDQRDLARR